MGHARDLIHTQIAMDRCTGENILFIRAATLAMQDSYLRLQGERALTATACLNPLVCPATMSAFQAVASAERTLQQTVKVAWGEKAFLWKYRLSCGLSPFVRRDPFPDFPFEISDAVLVSPKITSETRWIAGSPPPFRLRLFFRDLSSGAEARKKGAIHEKTDPGLHDWDVAWIE